MVKVMTDNFFDTLYPHFYHQKTFNNTRKKAKKSNKTKRKHRSF